MVKPKFLSKFLKFILEKIGIKLDAHKLKLLIDYGFIFAEKLIIKLDKLLPFYFDFYKDMVEKEIFFGNISSKNNVLHIGCGSIPVTSILIADLTNAFVTCIDKSKKSVVEAEYIVSKIKNKNKIRLINSDIMDFPVKDYDIIIFSQGIKPYKESLGKLSREINPNTKLIFRTSSNLNGEIKKYDYFIKDIFNIDDIVYHKKNGLLMSILLRRKN